MAKFIYKAKADPKTIKEGEIEAENRDQAVSQLIESGLYPISVRSKTESLAEGPSASSARLKRVKVRDIVLFTRELSDLLESGVNLLNSIEVLRDQSGNTYFANLLEKIIEDLKEGKTFSRALGNHPQIFSPLFVNLVRSGETSGSMEGSLRQIAEFTEQEEELKSEVRSRLVYPAIVLSLGLVTIVLLLVFMVPRLVEMFEESGQVLPLATRILIKSSQFMMSWWWLIVIILTVGWLIWRRILTSRESRYLVDEMRLKLPLLGSLTRRFEIVNFTRTLRVLLAGGISVLRAIEITARCLSNEVFVRVCDKIRQSLQDGASLSGSIQGMTIFPKFVTNMIAVGEEGGNLEETLFRIETSFQREAERQIKFLTTLLEPVLILSVGLIVFFIVLAMLLPIFELNIGGL